MNRPIQNIILLSTNTVIKEKKDVERLPEDAELEVIFENHKSEPSSVAEPAEAAAATASVLADNSSIYADSVYC